MKIAMNNISDMSLMNMKSQMKLMNLMQKIGKGKRKVAIPLDRSAQKFMSSFVKELKKMTEQNQGADKMKNIIYFMDYILKIVEPQKGKKRPKTAFLAVSYDEQDFLALQMSESIKAIELQRGNLKWYNLIKKFLFSSYKAQCENMYELIKKAKA